MIVYRLSKAKYANDLSCKGAEICGGRWNSKGMAVVYTSDSKALATTEIAVHTSLANIPTDYSIISIELPDDAVLELKINDFPADWDAIPPSIISQKFVDKFIIDNNFLALKVPSAVVDGDFNILINPRHKDIESVKIVKVAGFGFDKRLFE